ncbi:MAG: tail fiber domain-containing protein [candidate division Zixibacteria bacterium]|nr:tail fiber domain-containing protein [candidate division Zixibacteria bacterium]
MKRIPVLTKLTALLALWTVAVWAAVPQLINFQGVLRDGSGNPVANGSYSVIFTIYDDPAAGNVLWAETTSVSTTSGLFTVLLGSTNPVPDSAFRDTTRYLGIKVGADPEMTPRQRLVSVGYGYRVSSVDGALGGNILTKVSIGPGHTNTGTNAFVAGENNKARGNYSVVSGGGGANVADSNSANGALSTVSGGSYNAAGGVGATVDGGVNNRASGDYSTVGGGGGNSANADNATVSGGYNNNSSGGQAFIGGGASNTASGGAAVVGGGQLNTANGLNTATVGGGYDNSASGSYSTVGGGQVNVASVSWATVGGGNANTSSGSYATVGGGFSDTASGFISTVPGGLANKASGGYSFAAGRRAKALHDGSFVWGDRGDFTFGTDFASTNINQFLIRASNGVGINTNSPNKALTVAGSMEIGTGAGDYQHLRLGGGNSSGFLFGSYPSLGDGIHMSYNYYSNGPNFVINPGGGTSRISVGYGEIRMTVGDIGSPPTQLGIFIGYPGNVGIGTLAPAAKLHVNGTAGNNTGVWSNLSDRRLKRDIEPIQNALETVEQLNPVSFRWKDAEKDAQFGRVRGLIAQDVEKVIPEWIKTDPDGYKRLEPIGIDALLIEALKEQQKQIEVLKEEIAKLKDQSSQAQAKN